MSWVRVDDRFLHHPKVVRAGLEAIGLWLLACCWSSTYETDGRLPLDILDSLPGYKKPFANRLVSAGLWEEIWDESKENLIGFQIHDYLDFNPSAEELKEKRAATAQRVRRSRERNGVTSASVSRETRASNGVPTRPVPIPTRPPAQESTPAPAGGSPTAPADPLILTSEKAPKKRGAPVGAATWAAYAEAYKQRYQQAPVRNKHVNIALAKLVERLGAEEAPEVAAFYVAHNGALYVQSGHTVALLLRDAESLRMQWANGRPINAHTARQIEQTAGNAAWAYAQELEQKEREQS